MRISACLTDKVEAQAGKKRVSKGRRTHLFFCVSVASSFCTDGHVEIAVLVLAISYKIESIHIVWLREAK